MPSQLKILFVDDHEGLRDGVGFLLNQKNSTLNFVYASNKTEAINLLKKNDDILNAIIDINLDGENGLDLIEELRKSQPALNVLIYSMYNDAPHIEKALRANIQGYITKDSKIEELEKAISAVCDGNMFYNKRATQILHTMLHNSTALVDDELAESINLIEKYKTLTKKEQEIFMLLAQGKSTTEIADELKKAPKTVINQRSLIYSKLNISDRYELVNVARILGVIV